MESPPRSVLIIGSGVFGLSTALALTRRSFFDGTKITVVDDAKGQFPPPDCASCDSSRIIRPDYADRAYAELASEAQAEWRKTGDNDYGGQGRYAQTGLLLTAYEPTQAVPGKKTGKDYTQGSYENVARLAAEAGYPKEAVRVLENRDDIQKQLGVDGHPGDWGYLNTLSGWADASKGMKYAYERTKATGRVNFVDAVAQELVTEGKRVVGARLGDGHVLKADVVFAAAGAWTNRLIDLRGRCEATGHVLAYMDISEEEQQIMAKQPTVLNLSTGLFVITPKDRLLKVARHGYGYLNPEIITTALPLSPSHQRQPFVASIPLTSRDKNNVEAIAPEADHIFRDGLKNLVPIRGLERRPWKASRICWYSDTRDADWLCDWHPGWEGLFIATGDSGHGYKFLPVLGDKLIDCMLGKGGDLGKKWRWKDMPNDGVGREVDGVYRGLITEDGSRGGKPGMILRDELNSKKIESKL